MTNTLNLTPEDFDAISTVFEPVVIQGYGAYFKPKYEAINEETWANAVNSIQKIIPIVGVEAQEGTVYVPAEKTPMNDIKALQIATELLKRQTALIKEELENGGSVNSQASESAPQTQMTHVQPQDIPEAVQPQDNADTQIYGTLENKAGWMNALHASFEAIALQSDDGTKVIALRPREQNIKSLAYMKAVNDLSLLVPCKPTLVDGQRFMLAKTSEVRERFTKIATDLYGVQNQAATQVATAQYAMSSADTNRVVLKGGNILNKGSVFAGTAAPILQRRHIKS